MRIFAMRAVQAAALCLVAMAPAALWAQGKPAAAVFEPEELLPQGEKSKFPASVKAALWGAAEEGFLSGAKGSYTFLKRDAVRQAIGGLNIKTNSQVNSNRKRLKQSLNADLLCLTTLALDKTGVTIHVNIVDSETGKTEAKLRERRETHSERDITATIKSLASQGIAQVPPRPQTDPVSAKGDNARGDRRADGRSEKTTDKGDRRAEKTADAGASTSGMSREEVIEAITKLWEKSGKLDSSDTCKKNGHTYRIVNEVSDSFFHVARDDDDEWMKFENNIGKSYNSHPIKGLSIFVTDKGDVFVGGYYHDYSDIGVIWKNGKRFEYGDGIRNFRFEYIWVWGNSDVFAVSKRTNNYERPQSLLWLNGKRLSEK